MKARVRRLLRQRLSTQVVIMTVAILAVTMAAGFFVVQWNLIRQLDEQYEQRALAVAQSLASQPGLQQAVDPRFPVDGRRDPARLRDGQFHGEA